MFHRPTKRTLRAQSNSRPRRFTFQDSPDDWSERDLERDLVNLTGQLVEQGVERQFYGVIEAPPRSLGNVEGVGDEIVPMASHDDPADQAPSDWQKAKRRVADAAPPARVSPMPDGNPTSTTEGGTGPDGMQSERVASFPTAGGRYQFWMETKPEGLCVLRRDQANGFTEVAGRYPPLDGNAYYSADVSTTAYRIFKTSRQMIDNVKSMSDRPGVIQGAERAVAAGDHAMQIANINRINREHWRR